MTLVTCTEFESYEAVLTWDCVDGLRVRAVRASCTKAQKDLLNQHIPGTGGAPLTKAGAALARILDHKEFPFTECVVIMRNLHVALTAELEVAQRWQTAVNDRRFQMQFEEVTEVLSTTRATSVERHTVSRRVVPIIIGTELKIPSPLRPTVTMLEYELPGLAYMRTLYFDIERQMRAQATPEELAVMPDVESQEMVTLSENATRLLLGLTAVEASDALALCAVEHKALCSPGILDTIEHQKAAILGSTATLKYVKRKDLGDKQQVGGFDNYMQWLEQMKPAYSQAGAEAGLDAPKGVVLMGVPGTAKSMVGRVTARELGLPLVVLDVGAIFGSLVGQSEERMSNALKTIEAMRGAVVLVDEADKLWGGANEASGDSGVTRRVFGKFLSWLADKTDGSFVIMTINRVRGLPPEFLRKGRFDEIFYTDIPDEDTREHILRIHMQKRGLDPAVVLPTQDDWDEVLSRTQHFVGAEIEDVVKAARRLAWAEEPGKLPNVTHFMLAAKATVPLYKLDEESIAEIRSFCKDRARPVCTAALAEEPQPVVGRRSVQARRSKQASSGSN